MLRKCLDRFYTGGGAIASLLIAAICLLVCTQVVFNLISKLGLLSINLTIPSYADFAGYMLSSASFLALAYTLNQGGHIRVNLLLTRLNKPSSLLAEIFTFAVSGGVCAFATYYMALLCLESHEFGDLSPGIVPVPIWIPQSVVVLGLAMLTIALFDVLLRTIAQRQPVIDTDDFE